MRIVRVLPWAAMLLLAAAPPVVATHGDCEVGCENECDGSHWRSTRIGTPGLPYPADAGASVTGQTKCDDSATGIYAMASTPWLVLVDGPGVYFAIASHGDEDKLVLGVSLVDTEAIWQEDAAGCSATVRTWYVGEVASVACLVGPPAPPDPGWGHLLP